MADCDAVDQGLAVTNGVELFRSQVEASPAPVAVSDGANFGVMLPEVTGTGDDFRRSSFAGISGEVSVQVQFGPWRLFGREDVCRKWIVVEAAR